MITITLRQILDAGPCYDPRDNGLLPADHGFDAPIGFREIAAKVSAADLVWCFAHALPSHEALKRHFAVDCAERVKHLMTEERSLNALTVARKHALGEATDDELNAARYAAYGAEASAVMDAAMAAMYSAHAATRVAAMAAMHSAHAATRVAACAAMDAVMDAACAASAASASESAWQAERLIQLTDAGTWSPAGE